MATTNTVKLVLDDQVSAGLNNITNKLSGVNDSFGKLKDVIGGIAIGALIGDVLRFADGISDLSDATGIAIANITGFSAAVAAAGGSSEAAEKGILRLVGNIEAAASGSGELQGAFSKVGVSLQDLATLSEQDILKKVIEGLGKVNSASEQVALKQQLLGKEFRAVATAGLADAYDKNTAASQKYADAIKTAADTQDKLDAAVKQVKMSLLDAIKPALDFINALDNDKMKAWIDVAVKFTAAAAAIYGAIKLLEIIKTMGLWAIEAGLAIAGLVARLTPLGRVVTLSAAAIGLLAGAIKGITGIDVFTEIANKLELAGSDAAKAKEQAAKAGAGRGGNDALTKQLQEQGDAMRKVSEDARQVKDANAGIYDSLNKLVTAYQMSNGEYAKRFELDTKLIGSSEAVKLSSIERFNAESKYLSEITKLSQDYAAKKRDADAGDVKAGETLGKIQGAMSELTNSYKQQLGTIDALTSARIKAQNAQQLELFTTKSLIEIENKSNELRAQAATMLLPLQAKGYAEVEIAARNAAKAQIEAEAARRGAPLDPGEQAKYYEAARKGIDDVKKAQDELNAVTAQYNLMMFQRKDDLDVQKKIRDIQHDMATSTMSELEKKYSDITYAARESAKAAIEAEEARRGGVKLDPSEAEAYYKAAEEGAKRVVKATGESYSKSREFATGWKKALNEYSDEATNAAKRAESIFKKATSGMEDALVNFAKTGKFEWKGFVAMMLEELLRAQIQQIFAGLLGGMQGAMGSMSGGGGGGGQGQSQGGGGGILDAIGGLFGLGGGGAPGSSANNPMYVVSVGGGIGGGDPLGDFINKLPGMQQDKGGGIFDSIKGIFSGIGDSISGAFGGITDAIGGLFGGGGGAAANTGGGGGWMDALGGIGDLFAGFFAGGGTIPGGKFGVVGENGPELVSGPADVNPMAGGSNVTFNINAVDAQSFKSMIAADPAFLYGVAMQGAKGIPMRG